MPQFSMREKIDEVAEEVPDPLVPPENVTKGEAPGTANTQLKQFNRAVSFHGRVLEFLNHGCSVQFYMIWFSPATKFGKREFMVT
ncbi:hypothetical protein ACE6H2_021709 [Prunus campanulata]